MKSYDAAVIGGGAGGIYAALELAHAGMNVCIVESRPDHLGGTCMNEGCIPVKSLVESAELYARIRGANAFGLDASVEPPDWKRIVQTAKETGAKLRGGVLTRLKQAKVDVIYGTANFLDDKTVEVVSDGGAEKLSAGKFIIATGSVPKPLPGIAVDEKYLLTSTGILGIEALPRSILIAGGGVIGCEFASIFSMLGVETTVVEILPRILASEDEEASRTLAREFKKRGIRILAASKIKSYRVQDGRVNVEIVPANGLEGGEVRDYDKVLIASGRTPALDGLGLDKAGVLIEKSFVSVDKKLVTTQPNIAACGDVIATPMLAHTAEREGRVCARSLAGVKGLPVPRYVPRIVFSEPQIGAAGLTEEQAKAAYPDPVVKKGFFKANGRAAVMQNDAGFVKLIAEKKGGKLVGGVVVGPQATELVHELTLALENRLTIDAVARTLHGHPTLSELIGETAIEE